MKGSGGGLEQTLQPPLPDSASTIRNNGTANSHGHSNNETVDCIGEAPMDLDDSVSQQNHLIQQPLLQPIINAPTSAAANHQSLFTPNLITQIPPNPTISFSNMAATGPLASTQHAIHLQSLQHQAPKLPSLMDQPFHHIQPTAQQPSTQRLLQPVRLIDLI